MWLLPSRLSASSASVPASECSTREPVSPSPGPALWVTSSGTPTLRPFSWRGWKTRPWSRLLFGAATLRTSPPNDGLDAWTESLRASPALPSPTPASGKASQTSDGSCPRSCDWFARLNPDGSFSKMSGDCCQLMLDGSSERYSGSYPRAGSMRNGSLSERATWAPRMSGNGCSSWPTPDAGAQNRDNKSDSENASIRPCLGKAARQWQTPRVNEAKGSAYQRADGKVYETLTGEARNWPTPTAAPEAPNLNSNQVNGPTSLGEAASRWTTPQAHDSGAGNPSRVGRYGTKHGAKNLSDDVMVWPSPNSRDHKGKDLNSRRGGASLSHFVEKGQRTHPSRRVRVISVHGQELSKTDLRTTERRRLNPAFVCWLMGWPWWWTRAERISFAAEEMESWRFRQRALLRSLTAERERI